MKAISDYIHSKGLKLGLYSDAGYKTCGGYVSSRGHEFQDAIMFAKWGADYLKYDWCNSENLNPVGAYTTMRDALYAAGRPIVFSLCEWGANEPWQWAENIGHLWRTTPDIHNCWDCTMEYSKDYKKYGVMQILDMQEGLRAYAGPGHWNDPDMLEVGNGVLTPSEDRAHFSMWAMIAAPLIAGNDLRKMTRETLSILTNTDVIAIDQDPLGIQGFRYSSEDGLETWFKPLENGDWAVCFLNRSDTNKTAAFNWKTTPFSDPVSHRSFEGSWQNFKVFNLWNKSQMGTTARPLNENVNPHDVLMIRLIRQ